MTDPADELTRMAQEDGMYDMTDEIKPRIDEDGVGWCVPGCPFGDKENGAPLSDKAEEELCLMTPWEVVCHVHARRMAGALHEIAYHRSICYEANGGGQYGIGVTDGHRACAQIARAAIDAAKDGGK